MVPSPKAPGNPSKSNKLGLNKSLRKIRATKIVNALLEPGATREAVAKQIGVSSKTIEREVAYAEKAGILKDAQDILAQELIPRAMELYKQHLQMQLDKADRKGAEPPDLDAAKEVLKGVHIFAGTNRPSVFEDNTQPQEVLTLEAYYEQRQLDAPKPERHIRLPVIEVPGEEEPGDGQILRGDDDQRTDVEGTGDGEGEPRLHDAPSDSGTRSPERHD